MKQKFEMLVVDAVVKSFVSKTSAVDIIADLIVYWENGVQFIPVGVVETKEDFQDYIWSLKYGPNGVRLVAEEKKESEDPFLAQKHLGLMVGKAVTDFGTLYLFHGQYESLRRANVELAREGYMSEYPRPFLAFNQSYEDMVVIMTESMEPSVLAHEIFHATIHLAHFHMWKWDVDNHEHLALLNETLHRAVGSILSEFSK